MLVDARDRDKRNDPVVRDRCDLVRPIRHHSDQPVVQGAALIMLVVNTRVMLMRGFLRVEGREFYDVAGVTILMPVST